MRSLQAAYQFSWTVGSFVMQTVEQRRTFLHCVYIEQVKEFVTANDQGDEEYAKAALARMTRTAQECSSLDAFKAD